MNEIFLKTDFPLAFDSPDHLFPYGTAQDNSVNERFNAKLFALMASRTPFHEIKILDLGCAGGGFVRSCLNRGAFAIGLEGSDFSKKRYRAEWPLLADKRLFTADISRPFALFRKQETLCFDVITSWEVFEHLAEERVDQAIQNIRTHLKESGLAILSISPNDSTVNGTQLHLCIQSKSWWLEKFHQHGLIHMTRYEHYFNGQYVRGPKQNAPGSFHLILSPNPQLSPEPPPISFKGKLLDYWIGSSLDRKLKKFMNFPA